MKGKHPLKTVPVYCSETPEIEPNLENIHVPSLIVWNVFIKFIGTHTITENCCWIGNLKGWFVAALVDKKTKRQKDIKTKTKKRIQ